MKNCIRILICLLTLGMFATVVSSVAVESEDIQTKKSPDLLLIRVTDFPPQYYKDKTGRWTGLDVELSRALVEKAGLTTEFVERPWSRALLEMEQGNLHIMMNISVTDDRAKFMNFIGPERINNTILVIRKANKGMKVSNLDELIQEAKRLKGRFAIQQDAFYSKEFNDHLKDPEFAKYFDYVTEAKLNPKMTSAGRVIGFFEDENTVKYQLLHNPEYADLMIHPFILSSQEVYFGVSKNGVSENTFNKLKEAFKTLEDNGTFKEIRKREWK